MYLKVEEQIEVQRSFSIFLFKNKKKKLRMKYENIVFLIKKINAIVTLLLFLYFL